MIIEIKPHKPIGKNSLYFNGHYLGKNNERNAFICAAHEICSSEVVIDNEKINGSWLQQVQKIKRNKNAIVNYLLTKEGNDLLQSVFDKFGAFDLAFFEDNEEAAEVSSHVSINDLRENMLLNINTTISVLK